MIFKIFLIFIFFSSHLLGMEPLVNSNWLKEKVCKAEFKVIEVGTSYNSFKNESIECANFTNFYTDGWRKGSDMLMPKAQELSKIISDLNITNSDNVVLYAKTASTFAVAEVTAIYFTFKYLGHENVAILDGGFPGFKKINPMLIYPGENQGKSKEMFKHKLNKKIYATEEDVYENQKNQLTLVDSREKDFYLGINKLEGFDYFGTLEGSLNLPIMWNMKSRGLYFNDYEKIRSIYKHLKIKNENKPIFYCYSGLESSLNWFVAHEILLYKNARLYNDSLFGWTKKKNNLSVLKKDKNI